MNIWKFDIDGLLKLSGREREVPMSLTIFFDPHLHIAPSDFANAWNNTPECRGAADATLMRNPPLTYDPTVETVNAVLIGLATGILASGIYDLIKLVLVRLGHSVEEIKIEILQNSDGSTSLKIYKG